MAVNRAAFYIDDGGATSTGHNYGPFNVPVIGKLLRVKVRGAIVFQPTTGSGSSIIIDTVLWGVQHGPAGYTPWDVYANPENPAWLAWEAHVPDETTIVWTPETNSFGYAASGPFRLDYNGQMPVNVDTDFYVSTGYFFSSPWEAWSLYASVEFTFLA